MSSIQENKFLCLIKLSYDISLKVTRAFTEINLLSKYNNQVSTFLKSNKHEIFHLWNDTKCCQCVSTVSTNSKSKCALNERQIEILFKFQGNGEPGHFKIGKPSNKVIQQCLCRMSERSVSLNDFDIHLLETLLKTFANLEMDDKMWLSTIREIRNCIAHATSTTEFDAGRLDKWWVKLEGSIIGLVGKISPAFYGEAIQSQINALKNSNMEAIYAKKLMDDVKAENMILCKELDERSDTRIGDCEYNTKQTITENNIDLKRYLDLLLDEKTGGIMRKLEELEAKVEASAKLDPNTKFRRDHDMTRKIHVACQVEADDIDELLTIKNLSDPDITEADERGDGDFKIVNVKQKCILLELTASPEILSSEEQLLNAIDQLINRVVLAGNLDTRVPRKMTLNLAFTSPLSREEQDVFSKVFCNSDKAENIHSDVLNQFQDYSIGTVTRETQTEEQDVFSKVFCNSDKAENIYSDVLNQFQDYSIGTVTRETQTEEILVDSNHSTWNMKRQMQQEIQDLHITVDELSKDNEMISAMVDPKKYANLSLKTEVQHLMTEKIRKHEMQQEIENLRSSVQNLLRQHEMLILIVDQKSHENQSLKTGEERKHIRQEKKDFQPTVDEVTNIEMFSTIANENLSLNTKKQTLMKKHKRLTVDKTVKTLKTENDKLWEKYTDKHIWSWKTSKSFAVSSTSSSITVSWDKMSTHGTTKDQIDSFYIKFKESNMRLFTSIHVQALQDDTSIEIDNLKSNTEYLVNIYLCYENGNIQHVFGKECTTKKSIAHFLMKGALIDETQRPKLYHLQPVYTDIQTLQHVKNKEDEVSIVDQIRICDMIAKRNPGQRQNEEKTVLLLGANGSGKRTLIDALMNFIAGVSYNDDHRFILTNKTSDEKKREKNQCDSQMPSVTVYRIPKMEGLRVTCGVNIIETPGFSDTIRNFDKRITDQIEELFEKRIDHLDAILIVMPLSTTRLGDEGQHVFSNILKMFDDDIKQNIFVAATFDDSGALACVKVLDKAQLPYADIFRFSNANIETAFSSVEDKESQKKRDWEKITNSFSKLFKKLESTQTTTIKSSKEVMKTRHNLEIQLIALEDTISKEAQDIVNYKKDKVVLDAVEKETPDNKKKTIFRRIVPEIRRQFYGKSSIICPKCEKTCHKNCWVILDSLKWTCYSMKNSQCTVCDGRCDVVNHEVSKDVYELHYVETQFSGERVVNRQKERDKSFGLLKKTLQLIKQLIVEINTNVLGKDALTIEQYIEELANKEEKEKKQDYESRTYVQRKIQEQLKKDGTIENLTMNKFM